MSNLYVDNIKPSSSWNSNELAANNIPDYVSTYTGMSANKASAKAWLNYHHAGPAVRNSFGVASVTDNAAGQFTVNFSTNFSNNDYTVSGLTNGNVTDANDTYNTYIFNETLMVVGSCKITTQHSDGTEQDGLITTLVFFGT